MTVTNPPLAQWQIDHIRKMQEELGLPQTAPDTEEDTMDGELNGQPPAEAGDVAGGLSVYDEAGVKAAMDKEATLAGEREKYYDKIAKALEEKRYGPSFSERMFQLSAAFTSPTATRGFGGVLGNIMPVLAAQQKARREGEISRREALEQLEANRLTNKLGLARQDTQTKIALARLAKQGVGTGRTYDAPRGVWVDKNNPRPTENSYTDPTTKRTFVKWQDGYWREKQPNGGYKVFEREGEDWVEIGIEGAR